MLIFAFDQLKIWVNNLEESGEHVRIAEGHEDEGEEGGEASVEDCRSHVHQHPPRPLHAVCPCTHTLLLLVKAGTYSEMGR